jgi:hypothetical protein
LGGHNFKVHIVCSCNSDKFNNISLSIPTTSNKKKSSYGPSRKHDASDEEMAEKEKAEMQSLVVRPANKVALMPL